MREEEIWLPVKDYEGLYEVSNWGNVRSLNYNHTGRTNVLKPAMSTNGYLFVGLWKDGKRKNYKLHRLVAEAFLPNPEALPEINHKDENKENNAVTNLEWCDRAYNCNYGTRNVRQAAAMTNGKLSKPVQQLTKDGVLVALWPSIMEVERATGIHGNSICHCCNGGFYNHKRGKWINITQAKGFIWKYAE